MAVFGDAGEGHFGIVADTVRLGAEGGLPQADRFIQWTRAQVAMGVRGHTDDSIIMASQIGQLVGLLRGNIYNSGLGLITKKSKL